ncbi:MAG TPA: BamA/TamA family outer membrane protein [Rhizomicrobium sp.]
MTIADTGHDDLDKALHASSQLEGLQKKATISPFALVSRARDDVPRLETALDSFGYFGNRVTITIEGHDIGDPDLPAVLDDVPAGKDVTAKIAIETGPLYHLRDLVLQGTVPESARKALKIDRGAPAVSAELVAGAGRMLAALQEDGYAFAKVTGPTADADDAAHVLDVTYDVEPGARVQIGAIALKGLKDVNEDFVRGALTVHSGDLYKPSKIEAARQTLVQLGVFSGVSVRAADHATADGRVPLTFDFTERKRHAVNFTALYSTDLGLSVSTTWSHRNLFGNAEQLNLTAMATQIGGNATSGLGYDVSAQFIKPDFLALDQSLEFDLSGVKASLEAYDQTAETLGGVFRRKFSRLWSGSAGLTVTEDQVTQEDVTRLYQILGLPVTANYDSTGINGLIGDPVKGYRASFAVTPTVALGAGTLGFVVLQASGSTYFDISGDGRSVLALRALAGSIEGGTNTDLPPDQRLYAGGSATVRGYAYQSIGPLFADDNPIGATSVDAATIEYRQRILGDWGAAAFVDAGQASAQPTPFTGTLRVGTGVGARYYTPIGAVRVDLAVPVTPIPHGDAFEVYLGLGQAF